MTPRELRDELTKLIDADPRNPVFDQRIRYAMEGGDGPSIYGVTLTDVTDGCDGSCQHPDCIYANGSDDADYVDGHNVDPSRPNLTDEGLHFEVTMWANEE